MWGRRSANSASSSHSSGGGGGGGGGGDGDSRVVTAGEPEPGLCDNAIITSKYTWLNLVPAAIWEQFRRVSNFYFLIIAIISLVPGVSPVSPATTSLPLVVVVGLGLARDVYEDFQRKAQDKRANNRPVAVLRAGPAGPPETLRLRDLRVGDVVRVSAGDMVPADCVPLRSARDGGVCYVSTSGLDGESSLKRRLVPQVVAEAVDAAAAGGAASESNALARVLADDGVRVLAAPPEPLLEKFPASVKVGGGDAAAAPLDDKNLLLRGAVLRNTESVDAVIVYTGKDTKVALNMRNPPSKLGSIERMMNRVVVLMFLLLLLITVVFMLFSAFRQSRSGAGMWYMGDFRNERFLETAVQAFGTFIILYHTFIPISMFVTLEFIRVIQGFFIKADVKMRSRGIPVSPKAGNLHEVLGNIEHILTDKTGTLTQNVMRFVAASIDGQVYDTRTQPGALAEMVARGPGPTLGDSPAYDLVLAMALTHAVVPEETSAASSSAPGITAGAPLEYTGQSPDEVALVEAARDMGVVLLERRLDQIVLAPLDAAGDRVTWTLLAEVEFSSDRKRMSVVVQDQRSGRRFLYTKGADAAMLPLLVPQGDYRSRLDEHLHIFAVGGLRTLIFGARELGDAEYESFARDWAEASSLLEGRSERLAELGADLERNLEYIGCTAVEDKLQDRVPETIEFMRRAGVRIWVLTGDKLETAENIGYSARLLSREMNVDIVTAETADGLRETLTSLRDSVGGASGGGGGGRGDNDGGGNNGGRGHHRRRSSTGSLDQSRLMRAASMRSISPVQTDGVEERGLIIEGSSLALLKDDEGLQQLFMDVSDKCKSVICARVTPSQKAMMVNMARRWRNATTLAIGDGGNDVSMIQEAHIGLGIVGKEGTQAALAADYSMAEFRHLQRLLTVHGRFAYIRAAGVINLSLYKNIAFSTTQLLFQFFCFATGASVHNQWVLTAFNAIITVFGPLFYGIFERDLEESTLEKHPRIYLSNRNNRLFSFRTVAEYTLAYSVWHGAVCFFGVYFLFGRPEEIVFPSGRDSGYVLTGFALSTALVSTVLFKFFLSSHVLNKLVLLGFLFSFGVLFAVVPLAITFVHEFPLEGILSMLFRSARFHLTWPVIFVLAFVPDFLVIMYREGIFTKYTKDQEVSYLQRVEANGERKTPVYDPTASRRTGLRRRRPGLSGDGLSA